MTYRVNVSATDVRGVNFGGDEDRPWYEAINKTLADASKKHPGHNWRVDLVQWIERAAAG